MGLSEKDIRKIYSGFVEKLKKIIDDNEDNFDEPEPYDDALEELIKEYEAMLK